MMTGLTVLCFVGGLVSIDPDVPSCEADKRIDWLGAFSVTAGLVLIVFVLSQGELAPKKWATPCTHASVAISPWFDQLMRCLYRYHCTCNIRCSSLGIISHMGTIPWKGARWPQRGVFSTYTSTFDETVVVETRRGEVRCYDDHCVCQLGCFSVLDFLGSGIYSPFRSCWLHKRLI